VVEVDAIPDSGWILDHWELDGLDVGDANPYTVTMDDDHTLTAVFTEIAPPPVGTIDDMIDVVEDFYDLGYIDEQGAELGLLDELYAAKYQLDRGGKTRTVVNILGAFINLVKAQSGKHIEVGAANTLLQYANSLIQGL